MKIALYIKDGLEQIVLTPETDTEKGIIGKMHDRRRIMSVHQGSFYQCQDGWVRQGVDDSSTIIVLREIP